MRTKKQITWQRLLLKLRGGRCFYLWIQKWEGSVLGTEFKPVGFAKEKYWISFEISTFLEKSKPYNVSHSDRRVIAMYCAWKVLETVRIMMNVLHQMNSSFAFRSEQTFFSAKPTADSMTGFTLRAECGHTLMHRIQEIHAFSSTFFGFSGSIAWTGHSWTHTPHFVHSFVGFGTIPAPPDFL